MTLQDWRELCLLDVLWSSVNESPGRYRLSRVLSQ